MYTHWGFDFHLTAHILGAVIVMIETIRFQSRKRLPRNGKGAHSMVLCHLKFCLPLLGYGIIFLNVRTYYLAYLLSRQNRIASYEVKIRSKRIHFRTYRENQTPIAPLTPFSSPQNFIVRIFTRLSTRSTHCWTPSIFPSYFFLFLSTSNVFITAPRFHLNWNRG